MLDSDRAMLYIFSSYQIPYKIMVRFGDKLNQKDLHMRLSIDREISILELSV
jgi:hypothetical protein